VNRYKDLEDGRRQIMAFLLPVDFTPIATGLNGSPAVPGAARGAIKVIRPK